MRTIVPWTWVQGTPRSFGDAAIETEWLSTVAGGLRDYQGVSADEDPDLVRYDVSLEFRVNPKSARYRGQHPRHGPDLDNLVKTTLDALGGETRRLETHNRLRILTDDRAIYHLAATKEHVDSDDEAGVWVRVAVL